MTELPVLNPKTAYALWAASYPPHAHNPLMQTEERAMLALLPTDLRGCTVLDAGCGSGRYLRHAHQRGAQALIGVDLSPEMLRRAQREVVDAVEGDGRIGLAQAELEALPVQDAWSDVTLCGLTLGHLEDLRAPLAELRRVTRPGGILLCSDIHPIGKAQAWPRDFRVGDRRYAVRHTWHLLDDWHTVCRDLGWRIRCIREPRLDPADIPPGAQFDVAALELPVAIVFEMERES